MPRPMLRSALLVFILISADAPQDVLAEGNIVSKRVDALGDPLPAGAVARLGSARFRVHTRTESLRFGPDDKTLSAALSDGTVITWDKDSGKELRRFVTPEGWNHVLSPSGRKLAFYNDDGVHLWDTLAGKPLPFKPNLSSLPKRISPQFSTDEQYLAVARADGVSLFQLKDSRILRTFDGSAPDNVGPEIQCMAISPDGRSLATFGRERAIHIWDVRTGKLASKVMIDLGASPGRLGASPGRLCFSPDGQHIGWSGISCLYLADIPEGKITAELDTRFGGDFVFLSDGKQIALGALGYGLEVRDRALEKVIHKLSGNGYQTPLLALSSDGKTLAMADQGNGLPAGRTIQLFDLGTGKLKLEESGHRFHLGSLVFSPDGASLMTSDHAGAIFWRTKGGERQRSLPITAYYSPIVAPHFQESIRIWSDSVSITSLQDGSERKSKLPLKDAVRMAEFRRDGRQLLVLTARTHENQRNSETSGEDALVLVDWPANKIARRVRLTQDRFYCNCISSPDGEMVVTPSAGGNVVRDLGTSTDYSEGGPIQVWDMRRGCLAFELLGHQGAAPHVSLSEDARWLVSRGYDKTLRIWEMASAKQVFAFDLGKAWDQPVAMSPDGRVVATGLLVHEHRWQICLWDTATGKELHRFPTSPAHLTMLAFSPNGLQLASVLSDASTLLWDVSEIRKTLVRKPVVLQPGQDAMLWNALTGADAVQAHRAQWTLIHAGDAAVALLEKRLHVNVDEKQLALLVKQLDDEAFGVRSAAQSKLEAMGEWAEPALRRGLAGAPGLEVRRRIEGLLDYGKIHFTPETLARRRAIFVLERIGSADARRVLDKLASGIEDATTTREAAQSRARLTSRQRP